MSQDKLKYFCSNPECQHKFTVAEAKHEERMIQFSTMDHSKYHQMSLAVVHSLCPKCSAIVDTIHVPADVL